MTNAKELRQRYDTDGYTLVEDAAPPEVVKNLLGVIHANMTATPGLLEKFKSGSQVNAKKGYEFYGYRLPMVMAFHWGLTSRMSEITGKRLLPTYAFFRAYLKGNRCFIHSDRPACEHSFSMSLGYSDDIVWPFDIGTQHFEPGDGASLPMTDDFEGADYSTLNLKPGDAVLYHGVNYRHGRLAPNPNRWSAHMFLHWIDADGPYQEWAFDKGSFPGDVDFPAHQGE